MLDNLKVTLNNNKKYLGIVFLILIALVAVAYLYGIYNKSSSTSMESMEETQEGFEGMLGEDDMYQVPMVSEEGQVFGPLLNPEQSSIMDGPGFEASPIEGVSADEFTLVPSNYYFLDDGNNGQQSIQHNLCSKSCCSPQYPTPHKLKHDPFVCANKDQFVPTNIMCNNTFQDSGCLCMTKDQSKFLQSRGGNGVDM